VKNIKFGFSVISLVFDTYTLLSLLTIKEKRAFPANLAIAASAVHTIWMIVLVISSGIGQETVSCVNRFEPSLTTNYKFCGVEAAAMYFATLSIALIWCSLALNLFILVVLEVKGKPPFGSLF